MIKECNICGGLVVLYNPSDIYGSGYKHINDPKEKPGKPVGYVYQCKNCKATVGCHQDTNKPFGTLANKETKRARHLCHELLDPLWKIKNDGDYKSGSKGKERTRLYKIIADKMGIPFEEMHFGMFDIEKCREAYKIILEYKKNNLLNK